MIRVKGIGKKAEGLLKRNGIKTVANLRALTKETRPEGLTAKALKQYLPIVKMLYPKMHHRSHTTQKPIIHLLQDTGRRKMIGVSQSGFQRSRAQQCLSIKSVLQI